FALLEDVAGHVNHMRAVVASLAVSRVPEPMPVVVKTVLVEWNHRSRSAKQVVVHFRRRCRVGLAADVLSRSKADTFDHVDLSEFPGVQILHCRPHDGPAAMVC